MMTSEDDDLALALQLQSQFDDEFAHEEVANFLPEEFRSPPPKKPKTLPISSSSSIGNGSLVAPEWEDIDPTPDLHALFLQYNDRFFWSRLHGCEVKWSPRMTVCAGVCSYQKRAGYCSIRYLLNSLKKKLVKPTDFVWSLFAVEKDPTKR